MKKIISLVFMVSVSAFVFAASYTNNTYQKLADEYTKKAQIAFDAGKYEDAVAYSQKAAENAELSKAYIDMMRTRGNAETQMKIAQNRISWAEGIKADKSFPIAFTAATSAYSNAESAFKNEDFSSALTFANASIAALDGIYEVTPLPEFYIWLQQSFALGKPLSSKQAEYAAPKRPEPNHARHENEDSKSHRRIPGGRLQSQKEIRSVRSKKIVFGKTKTDFPIWNRSFFANPSV